VSDAADACRDLGDARRLCDRRMILASNGAGPVTRRQILIGLCAGTVQLVLGLPYLFAPLLAPPGVVLVLWATWLGLTAAFAVLWRRRRDRLLIAVPAVTFAAWFGVLAGAQVLIGRWVV